MKTISLMSVSQETKTFSSEGRQVFLSNPSWGNWRMYLYNSQVFWMKTSACRDGTLKTNKTRWKWHHNTYTPHLVPFCHHLHKYALCLLVVCRGGLWKAVYVVGSVGHVVHVDVHGEWVMLWVAAMSILSMADMVCLACMQKLRSTWIVMGLYGV